MSGWVQHGRIGVVGLAIGALISASAAAGETWNVTIRGRGAGSVEVPVVARTEADLSPGAYLLRPQGEGSALPAQVFEDEGRSYLALILKPESQGDEDSRTWTLAPDPDPTAGVSLRPKEDDVEVFIGGDFFTRYIAHDGPKPYLYPLIGPTGAEMTRNYPMKTDVPGETTDHPHHRSFWFTFGDVNGIDFWT